MQIIQAINAILVKAAPSNEWYIAVQKIPHVNHQDQIVVVYYSLCYKYIIHIRIVADLIMVYSSSYIPYDKAMRQQYDPNDSLVATGREYFELCDPDSLEKLSHYVFSNLCCGDQ